MAEASKKDWKAIREVHHCPDCGVPLIKVPLLRCGKCGDLQPLRAFVYSPRKGRHIAECIDLNLLSQGETKEEAISKLQEAMFGYLETAFEQGSSTQGLVLRRSPLFNRLRYHAHCLKRRLTRRNHHSEPEYYFPGPDISDYRIAC